MSIKKLQDLLNTGSQTGSQFNLQNSRSPSFGQSQFSPLGTNFGATPNRSPSYTAIPGVHNMFYNPASKPQQEAVCPSPMFQIPTKKTLPPINSIFQGSRFTAAETNQSNNQTTFESNSLSNSLNSLLNQLQTNVNSQPRNLEELLQRSFNSMPSNSQFQSPFVSSAKSPFMNGYANNNQNHNQQSMASDLSKILNPRTLLETSLQSNNFLSNNQNNMNGINGMNGQNNEAINKTLVLQLAQILKQESESKIKSAIAELILKYRALGLLNNLSGNEMLDLQNLINGAEPAQSNGLSNGLTNGLTNGLSNGFQFQSNQQDVLPQISQIAQIPQQNTVPLSTGLTMNAVRNDMHHQPMSSNMQLFKSSLQPTRIDATRRELFAMSEPPVFQSNDHFQSNMVQGSLFQSNQAQMNNTPLGHLSISPVNALDQEMNSLTLHGNMNSGQFTNFGMTILSAPEKIEDLANEDLSSMLKLQVPSDEELPGVYNKQERIGKILKYKNKIRKWRAEHPVKRNFKGRSAVAGQKPRIKGKFVTQEEYAQHLTYDTYDCKKEFMMNNIKEEGF